MGRLDSDNDPSPDRLAFALLLEGAATAASECATLEDAAAVVLQQVCAHTGWPLGHLGVTSADGERIEPTTVWHSRSGPFEGFRAMVDRRCAPRGEGLAGRALDSGAMARTAEVWSDDGFADPAIAALEGVAAGFAFPVLVEREVAAVLEFYSAGSAAIDDTLCETLRGVCAQLGRVVERRRAEAALAQTEQRCRTLADSSPALMWVSGPEGGCTLINSAWPQLTGRPVEAELGYGWTELVHPDDLAGCRAIYSNASARQVPFEMEFRHRWADGEYHGVLVRGQPIGAGDDFQGYVGCLDTAAAHQTQAETITGGRRTPGLFGIAGAMIVLMARDGSIIAEYSGLSDGAGYPPGSSTGRLGLEFVHPDDLAAAASTFEEVLSKPGLIQPFQCRIRHPDGTWRWVEAVANNLLDYPPVQAIVISAYDITDQKTL